MKFSILIANYNNGTYFKDCYKSIICQSYSNWEVIIVDDNSTDDSLIILKDLIKNDLRFKLYENDKNFGCGYTKRRCVELANGEICGFVDPDDTITKNAISIMVDSHLNNPEVSLIHSKFYWCDENLNKLNRIEFGKRVEVNERFINMDGSVTHFSSFKKKAYELTEGIDASLKRAVDQDLYLKISETGPFLFLNKALYYYRIHNLGIASVNSGKAVFSHLKVIMAAEKRRKINLENEVSPFLSGFNINELEKKFNNPGFLWMKLFNLFRNNPVQFLKKLFKVVFYSNKHKIQTGIKC